MASRARGRTARRLREAVTGFAYILPALAVFGLFVFYPIVKTAYLGFYLAPLYHGQASTYVGFSQYTRVLGSSEFRGDLWRTVQFVLLTVPVGVIFGVALAVLAHKQLAGIRIFRTIFSSTIATSVAVTSVIFLTLLDPQSGLFTYLLGKTGGAGILNDPSLALPAVAVATIWQNLGFTFILMSAALQAVPDDLIEAASVDGSSATRTFWKVTLPLLSPQLFFVGVIGTISGFQAFGQIDILTQGGPNNATEVMIYDIYQNAFVNDNQGLAAVLAVVLFVILLVLTGIQFAVLQRRVFYAGSSR